MPKITKKNKGFDEIIQDFLEFYNYKNLSKKL
ncbi:radical SAM protein [Clostridium botulinum]|nr:radical SAM protein [Clostridium botulinum]